MWEIENKFRVKMNNLIPVIMSGGSGSRLWPSSRELTPKQFLPLVTENTMFQETVLRTKGLDTAPPMVICNESHRFLVGEQLRILGEENSSIILEPVGRNTAPAVALAALKALETSDDPLLLVLAADHVILDIEAFQSAVVKASKLASEGKMVTFGILPTGPETGYGYIKGGSQLGDAYRVEKFVEKPDFNKAKEYLEAGDYYWNSGMFLFSAKSYLKELSKFRNDIFDACRNAISTSSETLNFIQLDEQDFLKCPKDSIDYAIMEKTDEAVVVPLDAGWSDVGAWDALWSVNEKDNSGNVVQGDVILEDTHDSIIYSDNKLVATIGLTNIIAIETKDAVLIADKNESQSVKKIVETLKSKGRQEFKQHREIERPWGKYDSIDLGDKHQVKRISVNPGAKLSVQMHYKRSEHWVVVSGKARVRVGDEFQTLSENESVYIPKEAIHSLENIGDTLLELIEVQCGNYLGEDDIVRYEDIYGRV